jgi:hypothetical protein
MSATRFPYKRLAADGHCELCGRSSDELSELTLEPGARIVLIVDGRSEKVWREARTIRVCGRHRAGNGRPVLTPATTMAAGTSRRRPQSLALFDDTSLKRGSVTERDRVVA